MTKHIAFRITKNTDIKLNQFMEEQRVNKSFVIRKALELYLEKYNDFKIIFPSLKNNLEEYHKFNSKILGDGLLKEMNREAKKGEIVNKVKNYLYQTSSSKELS